MTKHSDSTRKWLQRMHLNVRNLRHCSSKSYLLCKMSVCAGLLLLCVLILHTLALHKEQAPGGMQAPHRTPGRKIQVRRWEDLGGDVYDPPKSLRNEGVDDELIPPSDDVKSEVRGSKRDLNIVKQEKVLKEGYLKSLSLEERRKAKADIPKNTLPVEDKKTADDDIKPNMSSTDNDDTTMTQIKSTDDDYVIEVKAKDPDADEDSEGYIRTTAVDNLNIGNSNVSENQADVKNSSYKKDRGRNNSRTFERKLGECSYIDRLETIRNFCRDNVALYNPLHLNNPANYKGLFVNKAEKTIYCGLPTTGTTHWDALSFQTIGRPLDLPDIPISQSQTLLLKAAGLGPLSQYSAKEIMDMLKTYKRVITVRHPMTRLITTHWLRQHDKKWRSSEQVLNFFGDSKEKPKMLPAKAITLPKFLEYAASKYDADFDRHLTSFVDMCMPCAIRYDEIVKAETMSLDYMDLLTKEVITHLTTETQRVRNETALQHFDDVDDDMIDVLLDLYRDDLGMFGYVWDNRQTSAVCSQVSLKIPVEYCC